MTPPLASGARVAAVTAAAMIAHQVAGKAVRDAIFLTTFRVEDLPVMMAVAAVVSLVAALWFSRAMVLYTPAKVVPVAFAVSGAALVAEWGVTFLMPRLAAVALYLHTALFGAVMISAFWSLVNETFAPHSGRRAVRWVTSGGTVGGVLGGLVAWRAAHLIEVVTMLPFLAVIDFACSWGTWRLRPGPAAERAVALASGDALGASRLLRPQAVAGEGATRTLLRLLWGTPYLRSLGLVVALGAVTSGLLDYVLSAVAVRHYPDGAELLVFFAKFWLVVGLLSFVLEMVFGRLALDKLGLGVSVTILPVIVVLGSVFGIAVPGLFSMVVLRGGEASQRNSLFRAAYELLYTPMAAEKKRAAKTLIDVGCDRAGTVVAALVALVTVALCDASVATVVLLVIAMVCGVVSVARSVPLRRGYVLLLEESLQRAEEQMTPVLDPTAAQAADEAVLRDQISDALERLEAAPNAHASVDHELLAVLDLRSGAKERIHRILAAREPLPASLVGFALPLLASDDFAPAAITALVNAAASCTGQLVDALCDVRLDVRARRLVPRVLACLPTTTGAEGLLRGIEDEQFEVRYACGRALLSMRAANPAILVPLDAVLAIVRREVQREQTVLAADLAAELHGGEDESGVASALDERLRGDRLDRNLEHVFNVLALHFDREPLRTSFRALHEAGDAARGTALEYLDTVLPHDLRDLVRPFLGDTRGIKAARSAEDILADLVRAQAR